MVERLVLITSDMFAERADLLAVFANREEPSVALKYLQRQCHKVSEDRIYTIYQSESEKKILSIEIDNALPSKSYAELFSFFIDSFSQTYGKNLIVSIPEGDNFQSIAIGFISACKKVLNTDLSLKVHVHENYSKIMKPLLDKLHIIILKKEAVKKYLLESLSCTECEKFSYLPLKKKCCNEVICTRCGYRDKSICKSCQVDLKDLRVFEEAKEICRNAPYICACGQTLPFSSVAEHISGCFAGEVECKICNEMTKLSNFIAHMRMCHMDRLKADLDLIN